MSITISVRVDKKTHDFIKSVDGNFSEIWKIGFDKWALEYPIFLQKKQQEYKNLYIQCMDKMQKCTDNVYTKKRDLDKIYEIYVETGRSIENPDAMDRNWVKSRLSKIKGTSTNEFFEYCNKRFNDDKQQLLEVDK